MTTNPSHILIARNSRGPHNPTASLSSPTETHAAASGVFRSSSSSSSTWVLQDCEADDVSDLSTEDDDSIDIHETFTKACKLPGTVKIIVQTTTFWLSTSSSRPPQRHLSASHNTRAHKEILFFASPFFEAALSGNWSETGRPTSLSTIVSASDQERLLEDQPDLASQDAVPDVDPDSNDKGPRSDISEGRPSYDNLKGEVPLPRPSVDSGSHSSTSTDCDRALQPPKKFTPAKAFIRHQLGNGPDAVIVLREERATIFHDFLKYIYPQMECTITWNNVSGLMGLSHKLCVESLQKECLAFLLTHAAGKPIKAMQIAELFAEEELYRESSRFVLDNPGGWSDQELNTLSQETLLKLEKRRSWFLERVLKLGLTNLAKEYQCCPSCPDSATCAKLLDEKFKQAYQAVFRFGPPQPSMVFRYLRMLEGVNPPLALTQTACQASAKAFVATLFDRMFSLGLRGSGSDAGALGSRVAVAATSGSVTGPRRHFLYCVLKPEIPPQKGKKTRE